jgi:hypothetical protein
MVIRGRRWSDRGWRVNRAQRFRRSWRNASTSRRHNGPRPTRFVPPDAFGRKVGCGTGNVKVTGSNGGIGRWCERRMFPVFPALFPVCSHSRPVDSLSSQCSGFPRLISMDALSSSLPYIQQPGTLGTVGTGLKRQELGLAHTRNRRGTLGTRKRNAPTRIGAGRKPVLWQSGAECLFRRSFTLDRRRRYFPVSGARTRPLEPGGFNSRPSAWQRACRLS